MAVDPAELELPEDGPTPHGELEEKEAGEAFEAILGRLSERDGEMLRMHANGSGVEDLMAHFDMEREAARKALQRAVKRAQKLGEGYARDSSGGGAE